MSDETAPRASVDESRVDPSEIGPFSDSRPPPLDFAGWCAVAVQLLQREMEERFEILAERDIDPSLWQHCDNYWSLALASDIAAGGSERVDAYARRCSTEMATRRQAAAGAAAEPEPTRDGTPQPSRSEVDETSWLMQAPIGPVLPFEEPTEPAAPDEVVKATDKRPDLAGKTALATPRVEDRDATLPFTPAVGRASDAAHSAASAAPAAEDAKPAPSPEEQRALESYAALCAKLAAYPDHASQIRTSCGIASDEQLAGLHARWQERFRAQPTLRQRFEALQQAHLRHLAERQAPAGAEPHQRSGPR